MKEADILEDMITTDDKSMVLVEYLLPGYGNAKNWVALDRALLGEAHGRWRIVRRTQQAQSYSDKMMVAGEGKPDSLTRDDLFSDGIYETKGVKKKRIVWVQDLLTRGGAEISNELVIKIGIECGFKIRSIAQSTSVELMENLFKQCDIIILNNIWAFSETQIELIKRFVFVEGKHYVKYEHDHRELDRPNFSEPFFLKSKLNVFISPAHLKHHQERFGCDGICLPLAIDCLPFLTDNKLVKREPNTALVCNVRNFKSWLKLQKYIDEHSEIRFDVVAKDSVVSGNNVQAFPIIRFEGMPELYRRHEFVVHLLDGFGAGERVIFEGALSGCKIISDEHAGHMSWKRDLTNIGELANWLDQAPYDFWKEIDKIEA